MHICVLFVPKGYTEQAKPVTEGEMKVAREALDHVHQRNEFYKFELISIYWLTMHIMPSTPIQSSTTAAVLSTCSSGNRRPCKEDEDSCALMCLVGLRLQAFNERQILYDDNCYTF